MAFLSLILCKFALICCFVHCLEADHEEAIARSHHHHHKSSSSSSGSSSLTLNSDFTNPTNIALLTNLLSNLAVAMTDAENLQNDLNVIENDLSSIQSLFLVSSSSSEDLVNFVKGIYSESFLKSKFNASKLSILGPSKMFKNDFEQPELKSHHRKSSSSSSTSSRSSMSSISSSEVQTLCLEDSNQMFGAITDIINNQAPALQTAINAIVNDCASFSTG